MSNKKSVKISANTVLFTIIYIILFNVSPCFAGRTLTISENTKEVRVPHDIVLKIKEGIKHVKTQEDIYFWRGLIKYYRKDYIGAEELFNRILYAKKADKKIRASALLWKSFVERETNREKDFLNHLNEFIKLNPDHPEYIRAIKAKADYYLKKIVNFDEIIEYYHNSIKKFPENSDEIEHLTGFNKGYYLFGVYESLNAMREIPKNNKYYDWAQLYSGILYAYELSKFNKGIEFFNNIRKDSKEYDKALLLKSYIYSFHRAKYFSAEETLNNISENSSLYTEALFLKGLISRFLLVDYDQAIKCFNKVILKNGKRKDFIYYQSCFLIAGIYGIQKDKKKSSHFYSLALGSGDPYYKEVAFLFSKTQNENIPKMLMNKALRYYHKREFKKSAEEYKKIIKKYPKSIQADISYFRLSDIYLSEFQDYFSSISLLKEYIKKDERHPDRAIYDLGDIYTDYLLNYREALKYYAILMDDYTDSIWVDEAALASANILIQIFKDYKAARKIYEKAIKILPDSIIKTRIKYNLGLLLEEKIHDKDAARDIYKDIITFNIRSDYFPDAYRHYIELDKRDDIRENQAQIKGVRKGKFEVLLKLGARYEELGEVENAVKYYNDAFFLTDYKKHPEIFEKIVNIYSKSKKYKELIRFYRQIIVKEDKADNNQKKGANLRWKIYNIYRDDLSDISNAHTMLKEILNKDGRNKKYNANEILISLANKKKLTVWPDVRDYSPDTSEIEFFKKNIYEYSDDRLTAVKDHFRGSGFDEILDDELKKRKDIKKLEEDSADNSESLLKISKFYEERKKYDKASEYLLKYADRSGDKNRNSWLLDSVKLLVLGKNNTKALNILEKILSSKTNTDIFNKTYSQYLKICFKEKKNYSDFTDTLLKNNKKLLKVVLEDQLKFLETQEDQTDKIVYTIDKLLTIQGVEKDPLLQRLIDIEMEKGDYKEAVSNIDKLLLLIKKPEDRFHILVKRANIMKIFFNDYKDAKKDYIKALATDAGDTIEVADIKNKLSILDEGDKLSEYLDFVDTNLSSPNLPATYLKIAEIYEDYFDDLDSAEKYYNLLISGFSEKKESEIARKKLSRLSIKKLIKAYREYLSSNNKVEHKKEIEYRIARMLLDDLSEYSKGVSQLRKIMNECTPEEKLYDKCRYSIIEAAYDFNKDDNFIHEYSRLSADETFSLPKKLSELKKKFDSRKKMNNLYKEKKYLEGMKLAIVPLHDYNSFFDNSLNAIKTISTETQIIKEIEKIQTVVPYNIMMRRLPALLPRVSINGKNSIFRIMANINWEDEPEKSIAFSLERSYINTKEIETISEKVIKALKSDILIRDFKDIFRLSDRIRSKDPGKGRFIAALAFYKTKNIKKAIELLNSVIASKELVGKEYDDLSKKWDIELKIKTLKRAFDMNVTAEKSIFFLRASELWESIDKKAALLYLDKLIELEYRPTDPEWSVPILFKASSLAEELLEYEKAISYLRKIVVRFNDLRPAVKAQKEIALIAADKLKNSNMLTDSKERFKRYYPGLFDKKFWDTVVVAKEVEKPSAEGKEKFKPTKINKQDLKDYYDQIKKLRAQESEFTGSLKGAEIIEKIADIYLKIGDYKNNVLELERIVKNYSAESRPKEIELKIAENSSKYLKDYDKSEKYLRMYIDSNSDEKSSTRGLVLLSKLYSDNMEDYGKAIDTLQELNERFSISKEGKESIYKEAKIYDEKLNQYDKAIELYQKFIDDNIDNDLAGQAALRIAKIYESVYSDYDKAKKQYEYIIDTFPQVEYRDRAQEDINTLKDEGKIN